MCGKRRRTREKRITTKKKQKHKKERKKRGKKKKGEREALKCLYNFFALEYENTHTQTSSRGCLF